MNDLTEFYKDPSWLTPFLPLIALALFLNIIDIIRYRVFNALF